MRGLFSLLFNMLTRFLRAEWDSGKVLNGEAIKFAPKLSCVTGHCILKVSFHSRPAKLPLSHGRCMCPFHPASALSSTRCWPRSTSASSLPLSSPSPGGLGNFAVPPGPHAQRCLEVVKATWSRAPVISPSVCTHTK